MDDMLIKQYLLKHMFLFTIVTLSSNIQALYSSHFTPLEIPKINIQGFHFIKVLLKTQATSEETQDYNVCQKGGVICISEVTDIYPGNLDSGLFFIQSGFSHDVLCI